MLVLPGNSLNKQSLVLRSDTHGVSRAYWRKNGQIERKEQEKSQARHSRGVAILYRPRGRNLGLAGGELADNPRQGLRRFSSLGYGPEHNLLENQH